eukprot:757796-Hanusia_phi.AAC.3
MELDKLLHSEAREWRRGREHWGGGEAGTGHGWMEAGQKASRKAARASDASCSVAFVLRRAIDCFDLPLIP